MTARHPRPGTHPHAPTSCGNWPGGAGDELADATAEEVVAWAAADLRVEPRRRLLDGRRHGPSPPGGRALPRASTCCSWRPATTSPRPSAPATPSPACIDAHIIDVLPIQTVAEQDAQYGEKLLRPRPDAVLPAAQGRPDQRELAGYEAWVTGIRREDNALRANARWSSGTPRTRW